MKTEMSTDIAASRFSNGRDRTEEIKGLDEILLEIARAFAEDRLGTIKVNLIGGRRYAD